MANWLESYQDISGIIATIYTPSLSLICEYQPHFQPRTTSLSSAARAFGGGTYWGWLLWTKVSVLLVWWIYKQPGIFSGITIWVFMFTLSNLAIMYKQQKGNDDENDEKVYKYIDAPKDQPRDHRILKKNLSRDVWDRLKVKRTPQGGSLWDCLKSGKLFTPPSRSSYIWVGL